jgi:hypothetical protein
MEHYNFIHDEEELKYFFDNVMPDLGKNEVYFISLSARNKYLSKEEREEYGLGRTEMFERTIVREKDWSKFLRKIVRFQTVKGSYLTKKDIPIPEKCIIVYFNINPTNVLKSYNEFAGTMNEYFMEFALNASKGGDIDNVSQRINKMDVLLMNCFQRNRGTKHYIDIDFDIPKNETWILTKFLSNLKENNITYYVIDTKSGYHVLLRRDTIKYNFTEVVKKLENEANEYRLGKMISETHWEIMVNKNEMIPLPGTLQGGYPVSIIKGV